MVTDQIHERVNADELKYPPDGENKEITETPLPTDNKLLDQPTPSPAGTVLPSPPDSGPPLETPTKDNQLRCAQTQRIPPPQRVKLTEEELLKIHRERAARGEGFLEMYGLMKKSTISFTSVPDAAGGIESPSSEYAQRLNSLSDEQRRLIDFVDRGANVFFTGSAGTGKSYTLQTIVEHLKRKGKSVCVTAPTGIAATQIGGRTIHSVAALGHGRLPPAQLAAEIITKREKREEWEQMHVLIIDEISMLSGDIFEKVHFIACKVRYSEKPFGGVQLIVSGDFHQLPPVPDEVLVCPQCTGEIKGVRNTRSLVKVTCSSADCKHSWDPSTRYAFESPFWEKCQFKIVELTRVFRQDDVKLVHMLNEIRSGIYTKEAQEELNKCKRPLPDNDKIKATRLYPHKRSVEDENLRFFKELNDPETHVYLAQDGTTIEDPNTKAKHLHNLDKYVQAVRVLNLKIGTQVMLLCNLDTRGGLVNGSRGVVVAFDFERDKKGRTKYGGRKYPVVYFANGRQMTIAMHLFEVQLSVKHQVWRNQVPLIYGWSITIHKSQGMSIDKCSMDLSKCFGAGMAYVALSRVRSLAGLELIAAESAPAVPKHVVKTDRKVINFYQNIVRSELHKVFWKDRMKEAIANHYEHNQGNKDPIADFISIAVAEYRKHIASSPGNIVRESNALPDTCASENVQVVQGKGALSQASPAVSPAQSSVKALQTPVIGTSNRVAEDDFGDGADLGHPDFLARIDREVQRASQSPASPFIASPALVTTNPRRLRRSVSKQAKRNRSPTPVLDRNPCAVASAIFNKTAIVQRVDELCTRSQAHNSSQSRPVKEEQPSRKNNIIVVDDIKSESKLDVIVVDDIEEVDAFEDIKPSVKKQKKKRRNV